MEVPEKSSRARARAAQSWPQMCAYLAAVAILTLLESRATTTVTSLVALAKIAGVVGGMTGGALLVLRLSARHARLAAVSAAACGGVFGVLLTTGRRASTWAIRVPFVFGCALVVGLSVFVAVRSYDVVSRWRRWATRFAVVACFSASVGVALANARLLVRTYPFFHIGMMVTACGLIALALRFLDRSERPEFELSMLAPVLVAALVFVPAPEFDLRKSGFGQVVAWSTHSTVDRHSRRSSKSLTLEGSSPRAAADASMLAMQTKRLQSRSLLVITVDALRADALGASLEFETLAAESTTFSSVYTTTPNTSYALATLWSGELIVPSARASQDPTWIASRFKSEGYATVALYPPDVFFVDESRFRAAKVEHFGFEHASVERVDAPEMAARLATMLADVPDGTPILAWVHLLEPHEPYLPAAPQHADAPARSRYDDEVRTVGRAVRALARIMRAARPDATLVLTADHGEEFGEHGGKFHGTTLYEEQVRIPLIFNVAGASRGSSHARAVSLLDVPATLLALHGIVPGTRMLGRDLASCIDEPDCVFESGAVAVVGSSWMISDGDTKVIVNEDDTEVYALDDDPREQQNVWGRGTENVERLLRQLGEFRAELALRTTADPDAAILRRHELGERGDLATLVRVVASENPAQRADAVRYLSEANYPSLDGVLPDVLEDTDARVRAEAALAQSHLAPLDTGARARLLGLVTSSSDLEFVSRAARILGEHLPPSAWDAILAVAVDATLEREVRRRAIGGLAAAFSASRKLRGRPAQEVLRARDRIAFGLGTLLADLVLRVDAADALGRLGGKAAQDLLWQALTTERYPLARAAELVALARLHDRRLESLVYELAQDAGSITEPAGVLCEVVQGLRLRSAPTSVMGCACSTKPGTAGLACALPRVRVHTRSSIRIYATLHASSATEFRSNRARLQHLRAGANQVSFCVRSDEPLVLPVAAAFAYSSVAWVALDRDVADRDSACAR